MSTSKNKDGKTFENKLEIRFIDSFRFMQTSLAKLVDNLHRHSFKNLRRFYKGEKLDLLLRKGVFPYDWFKSFEKLNANKLPPKEAFHSKLYDSDISDEDHHHTEKVWENFEMKTFKEYHDAYLISDVLQLADIFDNFRDVCMNNYELDPAWYYTAPGLAWDALLKKTKAELELITDPDMLLMIERGIRGGVSMFCTRYAKANNKYMTVYDPNLPTTYIPYLDANNLYGWAMSQKLPFRGFEWMSEKQLSNWKKHPCILEVDLEFPHELHDLHNDYQLAPESPKVNKVEKLIPNLHNKTKYVVHHETLKFYQSHGLKITKVHRGVTFEESEWMKPYIELNTKLRAQAANNFEKEFFKLMNNSVFGKTMENIRNRVEVHLVTSEEEARKLLSKPNYHHRKIFSENLIAIHMKKTHLVFNKPIYVGMSIFHLAKFHMYRFHFNYIEP